VSVLAVTLVNSWAGSFNQTNTFGTTAPALQSTPIALTAGTSVGGGSGTPTAGNWLVCIIGWNQNGLPASTVAVADDIHSFWRPGNETTSTWAVSTATGNTRAAIWYTPNLTLAPGNIYVAPNGVQAGMAYLVIEIAGAGPWDTVTGINTNYAAAATSLTLALGAPSATSFAVAVVCGDSDAVTQAFAPGGWTTLHTVTATNGTDHTCDAVITSAWNASVSGSVSVSGSAVSATDLSGVLIEFQISASSPVPASNNPNWPYLKFEAAFGGGFQTPPDQLTWSDLTNRLWSWDETTGVQYQLGELQATSLDLELDNYDNNLASDWPGSIYYSNAVNANMSFQSGLSPWAKTGNSTLTQSTAQAYASSPGAVALYSMQVTPDGSTASPGAISEKITVTGSTVYSASAWFYSAAGYATGAQVAITWLTSGSSVISTVTSGALAIPAATWTQVTELNQTSPSNAAFAEVTVQFSGTPSATAYWVAEAALNPGALVTSTGLIATGVPLRIRAAIGTLGGVATNRWYVIQRYAEQWPQKIDAAFRRYVAATATDIWSTMSDSGPTPYRGEVIQDAPYAWWACDDQTLDAGVQPTTLRNSAVGNTNVLNITAASGGITSGDSYTTTGVDATTANVGAPGIAASVATYAVNQQSGWMYGDPLASQTSYNTTNPVTASPGSAAWQQTGLLGSGGSNGWFMYVNDASFPVLANGVTFSFWFNSAFFGSATGFTSTGAAKYDICGQPYSQLTLALLATSSNPVASIYLDLSGHLILETWNGASGTTHTIYNSSDLRGASWHQVTFTTNGSSWNCYVDAGLTASSSGSSAGMTSAWTYLFIGADCAGGGGSSISSATHMGNVAYSHIQVFPQILSPWRINAHYAAAVTGFGLLPAPQNLALSTVNNHLAGTSYTPDGSLYNAGNQIDTASYGTTGSAVTVFSFSGLAASIAGSITSGPSARVTLSGLGLDTGGIYTGTAVWISFTALAPVVDIYTAASASGETEAAQVSGSGDSFSTGFGSGATGNGVCQVASGTGASPPTSPSTLGDTVQQRVERCLGYGQATSPMRCIDPSAQLVQAGTDIGGQQTGNNVTNIANSDGGLLYVDNPGNLTYWQRTHLASQYSAPVWSLGPNTGGGENPYYREIKWLADPQRIFNAIDISPYSPDNQTPALYVPSQGAAVIASQKQFGAQPYQVISYLQSTSEMQSQANWLFSNYGYLHIRVENLKFDAAPDPVLWKMILGINVGDVVTAQNWNIGGTTGTTWTFRVSEIHRHLENREQNTEASVTLKLDYEPSSYWS